MKLLVLLTAFAAFFAAEPPGRYLADARGRIFLSDAKLAQVRTWRDQGCQSTFTLTAPGAAAMRWTIDWRRVQNVQISTRSHFITDVEKLMYNQQPGLILYGRYTVSGRLPDGTQRQEDNIEFFLKDVTRLDYAFNALKAKARECRS